MRNPKAWMRFLLGCAVLDFLSAFIFAWKRAGVVAVTIAFLFGVWFLARFFWIWFDEDAKAPYREEL